MIEFPPTTDHAITPPPMDGSSPPCPSCRDGCQYIAPDDAGEVRCHDCFGSGVQGDGQVTVYASRLLAPLVKCPRCEVFPHDKCLGKSGLERHHFHNERHRSAVAHLAAGLIDAADTAVMEAVRDIGRPLDSLY